jgi:hypothetical protein
LARSRLLGRFIARHYSWFLAMFNVPAWRSATTAGAALFRMPVRTVEQKKQAAVSAGELKRQVRRRQFPAHRTPT